MDFLQEFPSSYVILPNKYPVMQRERRRRRRRKSSSLARENDGFRSRLLLLAATAFCWQNLFLIKSSLTYQVNALQTHSSSSTRRPALVRPKYNINEKRRQYATTATRLYSIQGQESIRVNAGFNQSPRQISIPSSNPQNDRKSNQASIPAPVYITVGPPCAGKTAALGACLERDGYDPTKVLSSKEVALDEQSDVYVRVPLAGFLFPQTRLDTSIGSTTIDAKHNNDTKLGDFILKSTGTTLRDRLLDPPTVNLANTDTELRNVILRVAGRTTPQEFANRTRAHALAAATVAHVPPNIPPAERFQRADEVSACPAAREVAGQIP